MCRKEILLAVPHQFSSPQIAEMASFRSSVRKTLENAPYCPRCGKWYRYLGSWKDHEEGEPRLHWESDCLCYLRQTSDR